MVQIVVDINHNILDNVRTMDSIDKAIKSIKRDLANHFLYEEIFITDKDAIEFLFIFYNCESTFPLVNKNPKLKEYIRVLKALHQQNTEESLRLKHKGYWNDPSTSIYYTELQKIVADNEKLQHIELDNTDHLTHKQIALILYQVDKEAIIEVSLAYKKHLIGKNIKVKYVE